MAKNYTFNEAVSIIAKGTDMESIADLGRRYPILVQKVTVVATKAGKDFVDLMGYMPDYLTANKVNTAIKAGISETEASDEEDEAENTEVENEAPKAKGSKKAKAEAAEEESDGEVDYNKFNGGTLVKMCKEKGIFERGMKKADLVKALEDYDANGGAESADEEEDAATETENPYEGKSAVELFKECKKRGLKAVPKKPAKFYIDLLLKDDAAKAEAAEAETTEDEDDDWGDEEAEAPTEKKAAPKATAKGGKAKATKKAEAESDDDDDDWDI